MVHSLQWANVVAIENNLAFQFVPVLFDVVVLHHDNYHVNFIQELIKVQDLVLHDFLLGEEGVEGPISP